MKDVLHDIASKLAEMEKEARGLQNQNLADIIASGRAKITQAAEHPDIDNVGREVVMPPPNNPLNSGGNHIFAAGDPGRELQDAEAARRVAFVPPQPAPPPATPFPGTTAGGASVNDMTKLNPEAKHPGDPSFVNPNPNFTDPHAVNLNDDGTVKQAPNTFGVTDERDNKE